MSLPEPKNRVLQKAPPILRALRLIFTCAFLFLWFKGNFAQFKKIQVGVWAALVPLLVVLGLEFALKFRKGRSALKPESKKIVLVLLAALFLWIRSRLKYFLFAGLLVILVFLGNGQTQYTYFLSVKESARYFEQVIAAIE